MTKKRGFNRFTWFVGSQLVSEVLSHQCRMCKMFRDVDVLHLKQRESTMFGVFFPLAPGLGACREHELTQQQMLICCNL